MSSQFRGLRPHNGDRGRDRPNPTPNAEVVVKGRNVEVPDHFRIYVSEKLSRLERFDRTIYLFDVELDHEQQPAPTQELSARRDHRARARARGPWRGLRRQLLCRPGIGGRQTRKPTAPQQGPPQDPLRRQDSGVAGTRPPRSARCPTRRTAAADDAAGRRRGAVDDHEPGRIVRTKEHPAKPMTVDDALYEMELVGHDFFLFHDKESDRPCVVYRRHAYDYGLIRLA